MYKVTDEYGNILEETLEPKWLRQQDIADIPILTDSYEEANGILLSNGGIYGIYKIDEETGESVVPNMNNYPQVTIEEVSSDPYLFQKLDETSNKLDTKASQDKVESLEQQTTALMMGMVDVYSKLEAISASIESNSSSTTVETNE